MTVVRQYMNQRVTLERRERDANGDPVGDEYSGPSYEDPETIIVYYEPATGETRTASGDTVQTQGRIVSKNEIKLLDKVDGKVVKGIDPVIWFDGTISEYEAFL